MSQNERPQVLITVTEALKTLSPKPGDIVAIQLPAGTTTNCALAIRQDAAEWLKDHGSEVLFLLLPDGWSLDTIRADMIKALQAWRRAWAEQGEAKVRLMVAAAAETEQALALLESASGKRGPAEVSPCCPPSGPPAGPP